MGAMESLLNANESDQSNKSAEEIAGVLREILNELKEINFSLKSIARSQANQASVQKSLGAKRQGA